jgi:hypothetical protein
MGTGAGPSLQLSPFNWSSRAHVWQTNVRDSDAWPKARCGARGETDVAPLPTLPSQSKAQ